MTLATAPLVTGQACTVSIIDAALTRHAPLSPLAPLSADPLRRALDTVFAHYCKLLSDELNHVPQAHLFAFTNLLGTASVPAVPAEAPLAFKAAQGPLAAPTPVVPKFTEAAAAPAAGDSQPVVFQTLADLDVLRAELVRAVAVDARRGVRADASAAVSAEGLPADTTLFTHSVPLTRALHVGHRALFCSPDLAGFALQVEMASAGPAPSAPRDGTQWGIALPEGFVELVPLRDTTQGLTRSGEVAFGATPTWPAVAMHGAENCWLTCRLRQAASNAAQAPDGGSAPASRAAAPAAHPAIAALRVSADRSLDAAPLDAAFAGRMPVDLSRDFYPFGEHPRFGDVFYLTSKGFDTGGARITLAIDLTNPADAAPDASPIPPVSRDGEPRVLWELHVRDGWRVLAADDDTRALSASGRVAFTVPDDAAPAAIGGVEGGWLRARLVGGSYRVGRRTAGDAASALVPQDAPPSIAKIGMTMSLHVGPLAPECILVENGLERTRFDLPASGQRPPFQPFPPCGLTGRALFIGIKAAPAQLAGRMLNLYVAIAAGGGRVVYRDGALHGRAPRWQVLRSSEWDDCAALDGTGGLAHPGFVALALGDDHAAWRDTLLDHDPTLLWLRVELDTVADTTREDDLPLIRRIVANAVPAVQAVRLECELLGSANARQAQVFYTARTPVAGEVRLEVRESEEGGAGHWMTWTRVDDLSDSGPDARDFVLDRVSGTVRFGDGLHGRIPPAGGNNIRMSYSAGGGARGNVARLAVAQMRTTIPYVASVVNCERASGGQDTPDASHAERAALARLRHRDRAVCADDYADLARQASREVARATCRGSADLSRAGLHEQEAQGIVSVTIVPYAADAAPEPSLALLGSVKRYLEARCPAGVEVVPVGPLYVTIAVDAELSVAADASPECVTAECAACFDAFLHPVTGNGGQGWEFGREPHASDLIGLVDGVGGIAGVRALRLFFAEPVPGLRATGDFLIRAGSHTIRASR